jgi:galactokinase
MSITRHQAVQAFREHYGTDPAVVVRAPGRVNLIGEHTDYNHGFVLPIAINRDTVLAARPRTDTLLRVHAANLDDLASFNLEFPAREPDHPWMDYLAGVASELRALGHPLVGADCVLLGDVPLGCGLSSSAALEMAALCLFEVLGDFSLPDPAAAALGQRVENRFLGLKSGIMDQFVSRAALADHALFLDCRSLTYEHTPIQREGACFVIANTGCPRGLTDSCYNERVEQCEAAVALLARETGTPGTHLRDFSLEDLALTHPLMPPILYQRARHVISENQRTLQARDCMAAGDWATLGRLMNASGESLRDDYAVTSPELDLLTSLARALPGCFGARMTGAGFGGCTINLVAQAAAEDFSASLLSAYTAQSGRLGAMYTTNAAMGSGLLS